MDHLTYLASLRRRYNLGNWPRRQFGSDAQWAHLNRALEVIRLRSHFPMFGTTEVQDVVNTVLGGGTLSEKQLYTDRRYIRRLTDTFSDVQQMPKPPAITSNATPKMG